MTPKELAVEIWGLSEHDSRSWGARKVREVARKLFPKEAPGKGKPWDLTPAQARSIRRGVLGMKPP